ncbi:Protein SCO1 2, mitochondrial [Ancistrocladus abbreviatus]
MYRSLLFSFRGRLSSSLNLLQGLGTCKRCQCRSYARSSGFNNGRAKGQQLLPERTSSSSSLMFYAIPAAALLGIVGVAALVRYNDERRAILKGQGKSSTVNVDGPKIGGPFTLINTEGKIVTELDLMGNWVLLYFGYTSSPDVGPAEVKKMAEAIGILESKQNIMVLPVFVTIDPQRDSPSQLRAYLSEFSPKIVGLTGPIAAIRQMAQEYRVFFKKVEEDVNDYLIETTHNMYLMNPNMEIARSFGLEYNGEELSDAIIKELKRAT